MPKHRSSETVAEDRASDRRGAGCPLLHGCGRLRRARRAAERGDAGPRPTAPPKTHAAAPPKPARKGDIDPALRLYVEAAEHDPTDAESLYAIGTIYEERRRYAPAPRRAYARAVQIDPQHARRARGLSACAISPIGSSSRRVRS